MEFNQVETKAPHGVFLINEHKGFVLHDTRGVRVSKQQVIDSTLEALRLEGSIAAQMQEEGFALQSEHLNHYIVESVDSDLCISTKETATSETTRSIAKAFVSKERTNE